MTEWQRTCKIQNYRFIVLYVIRLSDIYITEVKRTIKETGNIQGFTPIHQSNFTMKIIHTNTKHTTIPFNPTHVQPTPFSVAHKPDLEPLLISTPVILCGCIPFVMQLRPPRYFRMLYKTGERIPGATKPYEGSAAKQIKFCTISQRQRHLICST